MSLAALITKIDEHKQTFDARRAKTKNLYYILRILALLMSAALGILLIVPPVLDSQSLLYAARIGLAVAIAVVIALDRIWLVRPKWTLQTATVNTLRALKAEIQFAIEDKDETAETLKRFRERLQGVLDGANRSLEGLSADSGFVLVTQESIQKIAGR